MSSAGYTPAGGEGAAPGAGLGRLTEYEARLVGKLLSDPTFFPIEFRTWLKQFIEGSGIIITASQIQGGTGTNVASGLPAGMILACAASGAVPVDTLPCDGTTRVRTDYPLLFDRIGTAWGVGDGSTTFNLPDLRDRALYGVGGRIGIAQTDGIAFGSRGGPTHKHSGSSLSAASAGAHSHGGGTGAGGGHGLGSAGGHTHSVSGSTSGVGDHTHGAGGSGGHFAERANTPTGADGSLRYSAANPFFNTAGGGAHSHTFSGGTDSQGGHDHGSVGDHGHSIGSDGAHSHTISGDTSGGFAQDQGSFAGVIYVITIGTAA